MLKDPKGPIRLARLVIGCALSVCALYVAYSMGSAKASDIPLPNPLVFSGQLQTFGAPDNSTHNMTVALFNGSTQVCITPSTSVTCVNGQFSISLTPSTPSCLTAVQTYSNLNLQVTIDGTPMGMTPVTAAPYAVIADNATGNITPQSVAIAGSYPQLTTTGLVLGSASGATVTAAPWETLTGGPTSIADSLHTHAGLTHAWIQIGLLSQIFQFRTSTNSPYYNPLQYEYGLTYNNYDPLPIILSGWDSGTRAMFLYPYMTGDSSFQPGGWYGIVADADFPASQQCGTSSSTGQQLWWMGYDYGYGTSTGGNGCGADPTLFVRLR